MDCKIEAMYFLLPGIDRHASDEVQLGQKTSETRRLLIVGLRADRECHNQYTREVSYATD